MRLTTYVEDPPQATAGHRRPPQVGWKGSLQLLEHRNLRFALWWILVLSVPVLLNGFERLTSLILLISFLMILIATWSEIYPGLTEEEIKRWEEDLDREEKAILRSERSPWEKSLDLENLRVLRATLLGRRGFLEVWREFLKEWKPEIPEALKKIQGFFRKIIEALKREADKWNL